MTSPITELLLSWYKINARQLPWRVLASPYRTLVSELMLQQTRVETVIPYFERWMSQFPDIFRLAAADEQQVLKAWEGLGYYSRARNLHKAAKAIVTQYQGLIPDEVEKLQKLPGIGAYTAGAIASIAYNRPVAAIDGNIRRVMARLFHITDELATPAFEQACSEALRSLLPEEQAGDFNQALMDLGATICLPKSAQCLLCPLQPQCLASQAGVQNELPLRKPKAPIPHYIVTAGILQNEAGVLLCQRPNNKLLAGLWEFPGGKQEPGESLQEALARELHEELEITVQVGEAFGVYEHAFTHFRITLHAFFCTILNGTPHPVEAQDMRRVLIENLDDYPMGKVDRLIANRLKTL